MSDVVNLIYRCIEEHAGRQQTKKFGMVTSYDPDKHAAKVMLHPDMVETGWLPIHSHHMGNGFGMVIGLTPGDGKATGDLVEIGFQDGDPTAASIVSRVHSDVDKPPRAESGEVVIQHQSGSLIKIDKTGKVTQNGKVLSHKGDSGIANHVPSREKFVIVIGGAAFAIKQEALEPASDPSA